jgi:hypothetical protein
MIAEHYEMEWKHRKRFEGGEDCRKTEMNVKEHECPEEGGSEQWLGGVRLGGGSKS